MNLTIRKREVGNGRGQWALFNKAGTLVTFLGEEIEVNVRRIITQTDPHTKWVKYAVEITKSTIHNGEAVSKNSLAALWVPVRGADWEIAKNVFQPDQFGKRSFRLGLQEYRAQSVGFVMVIDGLLWDGRILHVRDIAA